jgi:hypothetical protein
MDHHRLLCPTNTTTPCQERTKLFQLNFQPTELDRVSYDPDHTDAENPPYLIRTSPPDETDFAVPQPFPPHGMIHYILSKPVPYLHIATSDSDPSIGDTLYGILPPDLQSTDSVTGQPFDSSQHSMLHVTSVQGWPINRVKIFWLISEPHNLWGETGPINCAKSSGANCNRPPLSNIIVAPTADATGAPIILAGSSALEQISGSGIYMGTYHRPAGDPGNPGNQPDNIDLKVSFARVRIDDPNLGRFFNLDENNRYTLRGIYTNSDVNPDKNVSQIHIFKRNVTQPNPIDLGSATLLGGATHGDFQLTTLANGLTPGITYELKAVATATDGNAGFDVINAAAAYDHTAPIILISSPTPDAYIKTTVTVTGTVTDNATGIAWVTVNGQPATLNGSIFSCTFTDQYGSVSYLVQASDGVGNVSSASVSATVDPNPPVVIITSPTEGNYVNTRDISVSLYVHDNETLIVANSVLVNSISASLVSGSTYSATLPNVPDGPLVLQASAQDQAGNIGYATPVAVTVDATPPTLTIISPQDGMTLTTNITINITYNDATSGIDLSSLRVYHNDVDITAGLTVTGNSATGTVTGSSGDRGNLIQASIQDQAGNASEESVQLLIESGLPPVVNIVTPSEGETVRTNTPFIRIEYFDPGSSGVEPSQVVIFIDGINWTLKFEVMPTDAELWVTSGEALGNGGHYIEVWAQDYFGNLTYEIRHFQVVFSGSNPAISTISPNFTVGGDTVTITGVNFGDTVGVYFAGTLGPVEADSVWPNSSTQVQAKVPGSVISGDVWVQNRTYIGAFIVGVNSDTVGFTYGIPYVYITNRGANNNNVVTIFDYRNNTFPTPSSITLPEANSSPYQADVTPDGHWLLVANWNTASVNLIDTLNPTSTIKTFPLHCGSSQPTNPQALAISPDGSRAFVGSDNRVLSVLSIRKMFTTASGTCLPLDGDTPKRNQAYSQGSVFRDLQFSPDGKRVLVATDDTGAVNGKILSVDSGRYFASDQNANLNDYLQPNYYEMTQANSKRNPAAIGFLPQSFTSTPSSPWRAYAVNQANNGASDYDEESVLLREWEHTQQGIVVTNQSGQHPPCFGGVGVAISPLGDRAFFGFNYSNNIGLLEVSDGTATILAATQATIGCTYTNKTGCVVPWIREVAYTPYRNKVIAAIWGATAATSSIKILSADTVSIPKNTSGTISASLYVTATHSSLRGPEGIGVWPHFDRDGDGVSDLIEAINSGNEYTAGRLLAFHINPAFKESTNLINELGQKIGNPDGGALKNAIVLPEEGIGYRHMYGDDPLYRDDWGTLRLVRIIEAVGREWNQRHPAGPRISIGDMSLRKGGHFSYDKGDDGIRDTDDDSYHQYHQNGQDADLRYIRSDGTEGPFKFGRDPIDDYSLPLTDELTKLFCKFGVTEILVDRDPDVPGPNYVSRSGLVSSPGCLISTSNGHADHFHIKIWKP